MADAKLIARGVDRMLKIPTRGRMGGIRAMSRIKPRRSDAYQADDEHRHNRNRETQQGLAIAVTTGARDAMYVRSKLGDNKWVVRLGPTKLGLTSQGFLILGHPENRVNSKIFGILRLSSCPVSLGSQQDAAAK